MSAARWTTGVGIAVGGVGGAVAALLGAPQTPPRPAPPATASPTFSAPALESSESAPSVPPAPELAASAVPEPSASATRAPEAPASAGPTSTAPANAAPSNAAPPTTEQGLLTAEMLCDRKFDFDECTRAAIALETGTAGPANAEQGRRFRKIALTHMVKQCEGGSPHACFVLAGKYRSGEIAGSAARIESLDARVKELCRSRPAPECPAP